MTSPAPSRSLGQITFALVGFLFLLELTSGILQGYYVPIIPDLVRHLGLASDADANWFEGAQLLLSALIVPVFAKLGDRYGHKRMLLVTIALTAAASWALAFTTDFWSYLIAFALQGFYVAWLPLEVALIFDRGRRSDTGVSQTRRAAGLLVVALEAGAILGALAGPLMLEAANDFRIALAVPALITTLAFVAVLFGVPESERVPGAKRLDTVGVVLLSLALVFVTSGLAFLRTPDVAASWWMVVLLIAVGLAILVPFARYELRQDDPLVDLRMMRRPAMWPVQVTAGLFGISVLGAQIPLVTFAGTDPAEHGYGLGLAGFSRSLIVGIYLVAMIVGALLFPLLSRRATPRIALIVATFVVAAGYGLLVPLHQSVALVTINMVIAGIGSGALVAALPSAAAAAADRGSTGMATGMTNTTKTIGGAFASAVFGLVLFHGSAESTGTASSLGAYQIVWAICAGGALLAALLLFVVPREAFSDTPAEDSADPEPIGGVREVSPSA